MTHTTTRRVCGRASSRATTEIRGLHEAALGQQRTVELARGRAASLEDANHELEAFNYSVSHDLQAPLRHISDFSRTLMEDHSGQLDAEAKRLLGTVVRNTAEMAALIDDLLALSRATHKKLKLRSVDMDRLARSVVKELAAAEPEHTVVVDIGHLGSTRGDAGELRQAWTNLLANAFKFTRPVKNPRVELRDERRAGEHLYTVADNGVGFDPALAGRLFEPFERLHSTSQFEGTGIGLAIVARIVQRHGGRVWAEGTPGHGATFGFALPDQVAPA